MNNCVSIRIYVLSTPAILVDGSPCLLPYQKAEALLFFLAIEKKVSREQAASLLWESCDEATAKKNLRHAIYTIKKQLGPDLILSEGRQFLLFNENFPATIDYDIFMENGDLNLYQDELLKGFYLKNTLSFEDWLSVKRNIALNTYLKRILGRMQELTELELSEGERLFEQYTKHEALDEGIYRLMMELYESAGEYYRGIKLYQKLAALLKKELAAIPGKETSFIYERLLQHMSGGSGKSVQDKSPAPEGRKEELHFLSDACGRFLTGIPTALLLTGDSGSGKTYLAEYFLKLMGDHSFLTLKVSCLETEKSILLQPFNSIMMRLDQLIKNRGIQIESQYMEAASCLFPMFGSLDSARVFSDEISLSYSYRTTRNLLLKLFYSLSDQLPVLFFFDDIEYMDPASLNLLSQLISSQNPNMMFIAACPEPLSETLQFSFNLLLKKGWLTRLHLNPLSQKDNGENDQTAFSKQWDFTALTMAKIGELTADKRQLLSLLSACQSRGDLKLFEDLSGLSPLRLLDILEELKDMNLLIESKEGKDIYFSYRNNSIRKAVYEQIPPSRRRFFHEKLAEHLTGLGGPSASYYECLIYHYSQAEDEAMELKNQIFLLEEYTKRYYELYPMQYASGQDNESDVHSFPEYCTRLEERLLSLSEAKLQKINDARAYISLLRTKAQYCISQGRYEQGLESVNKALLLNRQNGNDPLIRIRCLRLLNFYRLNIWKTKDLEASLLECIKLGEEFGFREDLAIDCRLLGLFCAMQGDYKASLRYLKRSMRIFADFPMKSRIYTNNIAACYNYMGETYRKQEQFEKAVNAYDKAITLSQETPCPGKAVFYSNLARALLAMGKLEKSEKAFYMADEVYNDSAALIGRSITKGYVSLLEAEKGNFTSAKKYILQAEEGAKQLASPHSIGFLAHARYLLRFRYGEKFADVLPLDAEKYRDEAVRCLKNIPGIYELGTRMEGAGRERRFILP